MAKLSSNCSRNVAFQTKSHRMRKANSGNSSVNILQTVQTQLPRGNNTAGPQPFKEQGLVPVSSPNLLNRYNSLRIYVACVGVVHFPYPILIIISEQRDTLPTIRRPEFMNFGTPQNPFRRQVPNLSLPLNPFRPHKNNLGKRATKTFTKIPIPSYTTYSNRMMITHIFDQPVRRLASGTTTTSKQRLVHLVEGADRD